MKISKPCFSCHVVKCTSQMEEMGVWVCKKCLEKSEKKPKKKSKKKKN